MEESISIPEIPQEVENELQDYDRWFDIYRENHIKLYNYLKETGNCILRFTDGNITFTLVVLKYDNSIWLVTLRENTLIDDYHIEAIKGFTSFLIREEIQNSYYYILYFNDPDNLKVKKEKRFSFEYSKFDLEEIIFSIDNIELDLDNKELIFKYDTSKKFL